MDEQVERLRDGQQRLMGNDTEDTENSLSNNNLTPMSKSSRENEYEILDTTPLLPNAESQDSVAEEDDGEGSKKTRKRRKVNHGMTLPAWDSRPLMLWLYSFY